MADQFLVLMGIVGGYAPPDKIIFETTLMSLNKIEGTWYIVQVAKAPKNNWFIVKPATARSDNTISKVEGK